MTPIPLPLRMRTLPTDKHGRPVPWFVAWIDGTPDFRIMRGEALQDALRFDKCWVCGQHRGRLASFLIGPMCAVNRVSAEPPSHLECVTYSAQACPFMSSPTMRRRPVSEDLGTVDPAGLMIARNPGVALVWTSRTWRPFSVPPELGGGQLFNIGEPRAVQWFAEGRPATRDEVLASIDSGLPILRDQAEADGPAALAALADMHAAALELVPA